MECFKPLRCSIVDIPGEAMPSTPRDCEFAAPVFKLSRLGFLLPFSVGGFINEGDEGSEDWNGSTLALRFKARLLGFLNFRGEGDVIGRSSLIGTRIELLSAIPRLLNESSPKVEPGNDDNGIKVIGDSGEELGEGSDNEEESTVDIVVVGDESVESDACVDVLSRC